MIRPDTGACPRALHPAPRRPCPSRHTDGKTEARALSSRALREGGWEVSGQRDELLGGQEEVTWALPTQGRATPPPPPLSLSTAGEKRQMRGQQAALHLGPPKAPFRSHSRPRKEAVSPGETRARSCRDVSQVARLIGGGLTFLSDQEEGLRTEREKGEKRRGEGTFSQLSALAPASQLASPPLPGKGRSHPSPERLPLPPGPRREAVCEGNTDTQKGAPMGCGLLGGAVCSQEAQVRGRLYGAIWEMWQGGPSWHGARAGTGALGTLGSCPPAVV